MNKKQIIILIIVAIVTFALAFCLVFLVGGNKNDEQKGSKTKTEEKENNYIKTKDYKLAYGTYVGEETEYNPDSQKVTKKKVELELNKNTINNQSYKVKENSIYVYETEMYEVTGNNKFILLAGEGIEYSLKK